ncbi:MAG: hypothetical protein NDI73_08365 [Desulfuromonadales bacterium]|nr:hypothetical protein [Desulfuromonadales bacterium]
MNKRHADAISFGAPRAMLLAAALLLAAVGSAVADQTRSDLTRQVGESTPLFTVATSQGTLADYNRDYYGQYHLVLTFFPAAFTPI